MRLKARVDRLLKQANVDRTNGSDAEDDAALEAELLRRGAVTAEQQRQELKHIMAEIEEEIG
jgi:hypothetical protein